MNFYPEYILDKNFYPEYILDKNFYPEYYEFLSGIYSG